MRCGSKQGDGVGWAAQKNGVSVQAAEEFVAYLSSVTLAEGWSIISFCSLGTSHGRFHPDR